MRIEGYRLEICPKGPSGQDVIDRVSGSSCFVVSNESVFQPANARPPTGYSAAKDGLYERIVDGEVQQWAIVRYPSWVGTGFETARRAEVVLTLARFANGDTWEDGQIIRP